MASGSLIFRLDKQRLIKDRAIALTLTPLFKFLMAHHITPNMLSITGFVFHMASVYFFMDNYALFLLCFALFILFDALDGTYARTSGLASPTGGHVDRLLDGVGGVFFYLKAAMRLPPFLPLLAGSLFILNYLLMYVFHLEKRIGIFRWLAFAGIVQQYYLGLILDLFYFLVFCPTRLMYYAVRGRKSA